MSEENQSNKKDGRLWRLLAILLLGGALIGYLATQTGVLNPTKVANSIEPTPRAIPPLEPYTIEGQTDYLPMGDVIQRPYAKADWHIWRFYAGAGEVVDIVLNPLPGSDPGFDLSVELNTPTGESIVSINRNGANAPEMVQGITMPVDGEYTLWVSDPSFNNAGSYEIHMMSNNYKNAYPIRFGLGTSIRGTTVANQVGFYVFSGAEGQAVSTTIIPTGTGDPDFAPYFELFAPDGTLLSVGQPTMTYQPITTRNILLPETGNYTIWIGDSGFDHAGEYILSAHAAGGKGEPVVNETEQPAVDEAEQPAVE